MFKTAKLFNKQGFTLLEILLVVAAIGILAGIVIIAINPSRQIGQTNNAQRKVDVNTILNAVYQNSLDNNGSLPSAIDGTAGTGQILGTNAAGCDSGCGAIATVAACADLTAALVPTYIVGIPIDPGTGNTAAKTGYYIDKDANGRITVGACDPDQSATIKVTR